MRIEKSKKLRQLDLMIKSQEHFIREMIDKI